MTNKRRSGMPYSLVAILVIVAFAAGAGLGIGGFIYATSGSGEASRSVEDVIAEVENNTDESTDTQAVDEPEDETENSDETATETGTDNTVSEPQAFSIVSEQSEASFTLEEDLRGTRTTVVGTTSEVGGTINVILENPATSSVGTIAINARTLATDNDMRNRAIRSRILNSAQDEFEFIIFEPQELSNFSAESVTVGETITFDITGDLTVKGITQSVTFNASVTVDSDSQISGSATANVLYADYGLVIPDVPSVANVTDDVDLTINFVATTAGES